MVTIQRLLVFSNFPKLIIQIISDWKQWPAEIKERTTPIRRRFACFHRALSRRLQGAYKTLARRSQDARQVFNSTRRLPGRAPELRPLSARVSRNSNEFQTKFKRKSETHSLMPIDRSRSAPNEAESNESNESDSMKLRGELCKTMASLVRAKRDRDQNASGEHGANTERPHPSTGRASGE